MQPLRVSPYPHHTVSGPGFVHRDIADTVLTHFISMTEKSLPVINMRSGMVRMRTKGSASEAGLIFTAHRAARHTSWITVYRCIRSVFTFTKGRRGQC